MVRLHNRLVLADEPRNFIFNRLKAVVAHGGSTTRCSREASSLMLNMLYTSTSRHPTILKNVPVKSEKNDLRLQVQIRLCSRRCH
ncbi:unnamed protein product [Haemonchus placei]|uniref:Uncharacterized protein n=1 Tax=Haemonchus placei TaxID=6290 RepID=A0A3P8BHH0_HAEPC|nr:unnamed protein product [Haemonchus placei]